MLFLKYYKTQTQKAVKLLENTIMILSEYRGAFDQAKTTLQTLADKWVAQNTFENIRVRTVKHHLTSFAKMSACPTMKAISELTFLMPIWT